MRESIETILIDSPAAALGRVGRRYVNAPKFEMMSAGTVTVVPAGFSGPVLKDRLDGEKGEERSQL
jgi:hypothetical protein